MTRRKFAWLVISGLLVVSTVGFLWTFFGVHEITMTQAELQAKIDANMPHTTKQGVTISQVELDLSGDRLGLNVDAQATKFNVTFNVSAATRGNLRYNSHEGSFYFLPETLKVTDARVDSVGIGDKVGGIIDKWFDSKKILENKAEIMTIAEELTATVVQKSAETVLSRVPVYTLPDDLKGRVVRVFLKDVEVKDGTVIAHLSLWQFTRMVFFYIFVLVAAVAMTIALLACPEWGMAMLFLGSLGD